MNIAKKAQKLLDNLEPKHRECDNKDIIVSKRTCNKEYKQLRDVLMNIQMSMDSVYMFAWEALNAITEADAKTLVEAQEAIDGIEPDIYTSDLTAWLNEHCGHVYYLTQALDEYETKDGYNALAIAQQLAKREIGQLIVDMLADSK